MKSQHAPATAAPAPRRESLHTPPRVPYPQTTATSAAWIKAHGITVADLARYYQVPRPILVDLLRGKLRGNYGLAHQGAIVLGLKAEPRHEGLVA